MKKTFAIIMAFAIITSAALVRPEEHKSGTQDVEVCFILPYVVTE